MKKPPPNKSYLIHEHMFYMLGSSESQGHSLVLPSSNELFHQGKLSAGHIGRMIFYCCLAEAYISYYWIAIEYISLEKKKRDIILISVHDI